MEPKKTAGPDCESATGLKLIESGQGSRDQKSTSSSIKERPPAPALSDGIERALDLARRLRQTAEAIIVLVEKFDDPEPACTFSWIQIRAIARDLPIAWRPALDDTATPGGHP